MRSTDEIGARGDQSHVNLYSNLVYLNESKVLGFRTTKACKDAKTIESVQIIYMSDNPLICKTSLIQVKPVWENDDLAPCPTPSDTFTYADVKEMTQWTDWQLEAAIKKSGIYDEIKTEKVPKVFESRPVPGD
jgi:hypothetical protein